MEFELISRILERTAQQREDIELGPGDDAAVLSVPAGQQLVACTDVMVAGEHFSAATAATDVGWKALAVNLSDLAAMGASPAWALLTLTMPEANSAFVDGLADGFAQLARQHRLSLVGGDTTRGALTVGVTAMGLIPPGQALTRGGAKPGDVVFVSGTLGDAAGGLQCLDHRHPNADFLLSAPEDTREQLIARLNRPTPRIAVGRALRGVASACIDVSDGLLADLGHLCAASGVGAEIEAARMPRSAALRQLFGDAQSLELALGGGDDYELCFTVPEAAAADIASDLTRSGHSVTRIGRITAGDGVRVLGSDGKRLHPRLVGWEHFSS